MEANKKALLLHTIIVKSSENTKLRNEKWNIISYITAQAWQQYVLWKHLMQLNKFALYKRKESKTVRMKING